MGCEEHIMMANNDFDSAFGDEMFGSGRTIPPLVIRSCQKRVKRAKITGSLSLLIPVVFWILTARMQAFGMVAFATFISVIGFCGIAATLHMLLGENMLHYYDFLSKEYPIIGKMLCTFGRHDLFDIKESRYDQRDSASFAPSTAKYDKVCIRCHRIKLDAYNAQRDDAYEKSLKQQRAVQIQTAVDSFLQQAPEELTAEIFAKSIKTDELPGAEQGPTTNTYNSGQMAAQQFAALNPMKTDSNYEDIYKILNDTLKEIDEKIP